MGPVMHALVKNPNKFCFKSNLNFKKRFVYFTSKKLIFVLLKAYNGSLCGNGIVEHGEECDCGYKGECKDACCHDASENDIKKRCTLKPNAKCSPSQGTCCNSKLCDFENPNKVCMHSNECLFSVTCDGMSAKCKSYSSKFFKKNFTSCNSGTQVCINGVRKFSL